MVQPALSLKGLGSGGLKPEVGGYVLTCTMYLSPGTADLPHQRAWPEEPDLLFVQLQHRWGLR